MRHRFGTTLRRLFAGVALFGPVAGCASGGDAFVRGRAFVTAESTLRFDPRDPFRAGF